MDNYRTKSVLPTVSKVIEITPLMQLYAFLDSRQLLAMNQFGLRRGGSTFLATTQFTDKMLANMDDGLVNGAFFFRLDTIDHTILIHKIVVLECLR